MLKGTAHTVTTLMVIKKKPWNTKIWDKLSSVERGLRLLCTHPALYAEPKLPINGTPWKESRRSLSQKAKIFIIKTPIETLGSKVLDGGSVRQKDKTHLLTSPSEIFSRLLCISVYMRDSLLDSRGCSRKVSFVFEQSGAPFPARVLIILVTKRSELSAILNCDSSDLDGYEPPF